MEEGLVFGSGALGVAAASRGRPWLRASGRSTQVKRMLRAQGTVHSPNMASPGARRETRLPRRYKAGNGEIVAALCERRSE